jgi:hypothetical protein
MSRLFTFDEASALIPQLESILTKLQEKKRALDRLNDEIGGLRGRASGNGHLLAKDMAEKRSEADELSKEMNTLLERITSLGCELKGIDEGLIDFPHQRDGRVVYLCWKLGEERIEWWHDVDTGFTGRQPL